MAFLPERSRNSHSSKRNKQLAYHAALDAQLAEKMRESGALRPEESGRQLPPIKNYSPAKYDAKSPAQLNTESADELSHKIDVLLRHMSQMDTKIKRLEAEQNEYQHYGNGEIGTSTELVQQIEQLQKTFYLEIESRKQLEARIEERLTYQYQSQVDSLISKVDSLTATAKRMDNSISLTKEDYNSLLNTIETLDAKLNKLQQDENKNLRDLKHFTSDDISATEKKIYAMVSEHANISDDKNAALLQLVQTTEHDLRADVRKTQQMIFASEKSCISRASEEITALRSDFFSERENTQSQLLELKAVLAAEISARRKIQGKHDNDMKSMASQVEHNLSKFQSYTSGNNSALSSLEDKLTHSAFTFSEQLLTLQKNIKSAMYVLKNKNKELENSVASNATIAQQKHTELSAQVNSNSRRISAMETDLTSLTSRLTSELDAVHSKHTKSSDSTSQLALKLQILQEKDASLGAEIKSLESSLSTHIKESEVKLAKDIDTLSKQSKSDCAAIKDDISTNVKPLIAAAQDDIAAVRTMSKAALAELDCNMRSHVDTEISVTKKEIFFLAESLPPQLSNEVTAREVADQEIAQRLLAFQEQIESKFERWSNEASASQSSASHVAHDDLNKLRSTVRANQMSIDKLSASLNALEYELRQSVAAATKTSRSQEIPVADSVIDLEVAYAMDKMVNQIVDTDVNMSLNVLEQRLGNFAASSTSSLTSLEQSSIHDLPRFMSFVKSKLKKEALSREQSHSALQLSLKENSLSTAPASNVDMDKLSMQVLELQERIAEYKKDLEELQRRVDGVEEDTATKREVQATLNNMVGVMAEAELVELVDQNNAELLVHIEEMQNKEKCSLLQQISQMTSFLEEIQKRQLIVDNKMKEYDNMNILNGSTSSEV